MFSSKIYPKVTEYKLQFDGCSKGNPGLSGAGAVIYKNDIEIWSCTLFLGNNYTNNEAEYHGLLLGLHAAINELDIKEIEVEGDSMLVIKQMKKEYKVKSTNLINLHKEATLLSSEFKYITFTHIYRNNNKRADELSNIAIREHLYKK